MAKSAIQYRKQPGEYGTWIIEETGRCLDTDCNTIENGCTKRYKMEPIPNAAGAIMKVLDGTSPQIVTVTPSTYDRDYRCVKVHGQVDAFAPEQSWAPFDGHAVLEYVIRYQEVGGIS